MAACPAHLIVPGRPGYFGSDSHWSPSKLFGLSDTGDWWDASNSARIWTTSGATVLAGDGVSVGRIDGLKNGNNLIQGTSSKKPVRHQSGSQWYLTFDGVDDFLNATYTLNQPTTVIIAFNYVAVDTTRFYYLFDGIGANKGAGFAASVTDNLGISAGTTLSTSTPAVQGTSQVLTAIFNGASSKIAVNNGSYASGNSGSNNPGGLVLGIQGNLTSVPSNVQIFGAVQIGRLLTDTEISKCRTYFGRLAGLAL